MQSPERQATFQQPLINGLDTERQYRTPMPRPAFKASNALAKRGRWAFYVPLRVTAARPTVAKSYALRMARRCPILEPIGSGDGGGNTKSRRIQGASTPSLIGPDYTEPGFELPSQPRTRHSRVHATSRR